MDEDSTTQKSQEGTRKNDVEAPKIDPKRIDPPFIPKTPEKLKSPRQPFEDFSKKRKKQLAYVPKLQLEAAVTILQTFKKKKKFSRVLKKKPKSTQMRTPVSLLQL